MFRKCINYPLQTLKNDKSLTTNKPKQNKNS
uniref:Uncharacterized protein n=1 Tax=Anguilla anguilla TaxID=7936 RepID=A0A0E9WCV0_ANGAN